LQTPSHHTRLPFRQQRAKFLNCPYTFAK
jgi:hypothetical protein